MSLLHSPRRTRRRHRGQRERHERHERRANPAPGGRAAVLDTAVTVSVVDVAGTVGPLQQHLPPGWTVHRLIGLPAAGVSGAALSNAGLSTAGVSGAGLSAAGLSGAGLRGAGLPAAGRAAGAALGGIDILVLGGATGKTVAEARRWHPDAVIVGVIDYAAPADVIVDVLGAGAEACVRAGSAPILAGHLRACHRRRTAVYP